MQYGASPGAIRTTFSIHCDEKAPPPTPSSPSPPPPNRQTFTGFGNCCFPTTAVVPTVIVFVRFYGFTGNPMGCALDNADRETCTVGNVCNKKRWNCGIAFKLRRVGETDQNRPLISRHFDPLKQGNWIDVQKIFYEPQSQSSSRQRRISTSTVTTVKNRVVAVELVIERCGGEKIRSSPPVLLLLHDCKTHVYRFNVN